MSTKCSIPSGLLRRSSRFRTTIEKQEINPEEHVDKKILLNDQKKFSFTANRKIDHDKSCIKHVPIKGEPIEASETLPPDGYLEVSNDELDLERTLLGGQSFRWYKNDQHVYTGVVENNVLQLCRINNSCVAYWKLNKEGCSTSNLKHFLHDYFQLKYKLIDLYRYWSERDEIFDKTSINYKGFRILRQDPVENFFSFICATNNNIKRISQMIDKMCQRFGTSLERKDKLLSETGLQQYHSFPTVERLAQEDVFDSLRYDLGFGYRAKFITESAKRLMGLTNQEEGPASPRDYLLSLRLMNYKDTCKHLQTFPGVGRKVADCICLMSMDHLESVPIDCHIYEIVCRNYMKNLRNERKSLTEAVHDLIGNFFTDLHGPLAGWATSVLFVGELKHLKQQKSDLKCKTDKSKKRKAID